MKPVEITRSCLGICNMQVCAVPTATDAEILEVCNSENPAGTSLGWCEVARENDESEKSRPVHCQEHSGRKHYLVRC